MRLETQSSTANREGDLAKKVGIVARLLKTEACGLYNSNVSMIKLN